MRLAITIGRVGDKWTVVEQPSYDARAHLDVFKKLALAEGKDGKTSYHEVRTFSPDGVVDKRRVFDTDEQRKAHLKRQADDTAKYEAAQKKREAEAAAKPAKSTPVKKAAAEKVKESK